MIFGIVGEGGTGKSAITVAMSLQHLTRYDIIFTNIDDFNKNNSVSDIADNMGVSLDIKHFDNTPEDFVDVLREIEALQEENDDDEKFRVLVMYDECHKSLRRFSNTKENDIYISDFLSEHRHVHVDFYFMTQGYKKIADMYKGDFKAWYISVDDQLKSNVNDIVFRKMDKDCKFKVGIKRFKKSTTWRGKTGTVYKVFDCYRSGDDGSKMQKQGISLFAKKKYIVIFLAVAVLFTLYRAFSSVKDSILNDSVSSSNSVSSSPIVEHKKKYIVSSKDTSYSSRLDDLKSDKEANSIVSDFSVVYCIYDVKRGLYIFDNKVLTKKNFNSLNDFFLFEILDTQIISENVYKYEYLVNSDIANLLSGISIKKEKKGVLR
jgi:ABC-type oligopeptide transport system ATPase subunit